MDSQMKKGILELCILQIISKDQLYGYPIMKKINTLFPDVDESTVYAILRRFNRDELTQIDLGSESNGPQRKYYKMTQKGLEYLENSISDWKCINEILREIGIKAD